jgi:hypothetical protein
MVLQRYYALTCNVYHSEIYHLCTRTTWYKYHYQYQYMEENRLQVYLTQNSPLLNQLTFYC